MEPKALRSGIRAKQIEVDTAEILTRYSKGFDYNNQSLFLCSLTYWKIKGTVAQLVEQRTENPCVGSSILPGSTY